jgi:hypothetical protein
MALHDTETPRHQAAITLPAEGAVRVGPILGLPRLLTEQGIDADATIRTQGCDPTLFDNADNTLPFDVVGRLLVQTAAVTGCPHPGLEVCGHWGSEALGILGRTARLAPDLGASLRCVVRSLHLHDRGAVPYLWTGQGQAVLGYSFYSTDIRGTAHIYDTALTIGYNLIRELVGPQWRAREIRHFRDHSPGLGPFHDRFGTRVRFGAPQVAIVFPAADLKRPLASADPRLFAAALLELASLDAGIGGGVAHRVRRELLRRLASGSDSTAAVSTVSRESASSPPFNGAGSPAQATRTTHNVTRATPNGRRRILADMVALGYSATQQGIIR